MHLIDVIERFRTKESCLEYLAELRWPNGQIVCQKHGCGVVGKVGEEFRKFTTNETERKRFSKRQQQVVTVKVPSRQLYECKSCGYQFCATTGTVFHDSHLPLKKWFQAIALIIDAKKGMSALQVSRHLGLNPRKGKKIPDTYKTIWYLCHRIREATKQENLVLDAPAVEVDETYVGAKTHRPRGHGRFPTKPHDIVLGMIERGGKLKLIPIPDMKSMILRPELEKGISEHVGTIYSDEHAIYLFALKHKFEGKHLTINHSKTYGIGDTYTNTIESAFSLFKRGLIGSFHQVSRKHLARYCNEFSYRFNLRNQQNQLFEETVKELVKREPLTYSALTASETEES